MDAEHHFFPAAVTPYTYDGHVWAVPMWNMALSLWYRNSVFAKSGRRSSDHLGRVAGGCRTADHRRPATALAFRPTSSSTLTRPSTIHGQRRRCRNLQLGRNAALRQSEDRRGLRHVQPNCTSTPRRMPQLDVGRGRSLLRRQTCAMVLQFTVITTYEQPRPRAIPPTWA